MFDSSFSELFLIILIGLLILGPERLPRVAAQIGRWVSKARRTANQLRHQLEREIAIDEINRNKKPPPRPTAADRKPPGDETAGATPSASTEPPAEGDTPEPSAADEAPNGAAPAAGFGESPPSSPSPSSSASPSAPDTRRSDRAGVASVGETTEESTTTNS